MTLTRSEPGLLGWRGAQVADSLRGLVSRFGLNLAAAY
jgi:hypothetical protein